MFGFKEDVKGNLFFLDSDIVVYPCGHNIVIYRIDDRSQRFIPGLEGSEGITAMALSSSKKFLAVCEKGPMPICTVYNVGRLLEAIKAENRNKKPSSVTYDHTAIKTKKVLSSGDVKTNQFVAVDFCANEEKKQLVTLSSHPDCKVIIWNWDKQKCLSFTDVQGLNPGSAVR
jgi:cilia- and flagella-associated protein 57